MSDEHGVAACWWLSSWVPSPVRPWRCSGRQHPARRRAASIGDRAREGKEKASEAARQGREFLQYAARQSEQRVRARQGGVRAGPGPEGDGVSDWSGVWLGVIAIVDARDGAAAGRRDRLWRASRRAASRRLVDRVERDIGPVLERPSRSSSDAARDVGSSRPRRSSASTTSSPTSRGASTRRRPSFSTRSSAPAREGAALFAALRSMFAAMRGLAPSRSGAALLAGSKKTTPSSSARRAAARVTSPYSAVRRIIRLADVPGRTQTNQTGSMMVAGDGAAGRAAEDGLCATRGRRRGLRPW